VLAQIIQNTLKQAANDASNIHQFVSAFNQLRSTCRQFRAMLRIPGMGKDFLIRALGDSSTKKNDVLFKDALFEISKHGKHKWLIPRLVKTGADVNIQDYSLKNTPLHYAAGRGHLLVVQALLHARADVNAQDCLFGKTPLHLAVTNKYLWVSIRLIRAGANVNTQDRDEKTPLHYAIYNCDKKLTPVLIKAGAHQ